MKAPFPCLSLTVVVLLLQMMMPSLSLNRIPTPKDQAVMAQTLPPILIIQAPVALRAIVSPPALPVQAPLVILRATAPPPTALIQAQALPVTLRSTTSIATMTKIFLVAMITTTIIHVIVLGIERQA